MKTIVGASLLAAGLASAAQAGASVIRFDLAGLDSLGPTVFLGIDLIDGDGPSNSVMVSHIVTDGVGGAVGFSGGAVATPGGFLLEDSVFYSNLLLEYSGATQLSLRLDTSHVAPAPGMFADMLAVYLLDASSGLPSILTDEPLGSHALISWSASGFDQGELSVFGPLDPVQVSWAASFLDPPANPVPEPDAMPLLALGIAGLLFTRALCREGGA